MTFRQPEANEIIESLKRMTKQTSSNVNDDTPNQLYENQLSKFTNAMSFSKVFSTPEGKIVLELLLDQTIRRPSWQCYESTDAALTNGLFREGQNSIMKLIFDYLALAEQGPPTKPKSI